MEHGDRARPSNLVPCPLIVAMPDGRQLDVLSSVPQVVCIARLRLESPHASFPGRHCAAREEGGFLLELAPVSKPVREQLARQIFLTSFEG